MLQANTIWLGGPLSLGTGVALENLMTLVVALEGKDEVVVAADSRIIEGENEGRYQSEHTKLLRVGPNWILGVAGTVIGYELHSRMESENRAFHPDIRIGTHGYAKRMRELYEECECSGPAFLILAGVYKGRPSIYGWNLERDRDGRIQFGGAMPAFGRTAIGANHHGALYFANAHHAPEMPTNQRVLLAYFCVTEAAKHDPRVGGAVEVAVIREDGAIFLSQEALAKVGRESAGIAASIGKLFRGANPRIRN